MSFHVTLVLMESFPIVPFWSVYLKMAKKTFHVQCDNNCLHLYLSGGKTLQRTRKYGPIDADYFWLLYPNKLEYHQSMKTTIYCSFKFKNYPFESQVCDLKFGSIEYYFKNLQMNSTKIEYRSQHVKGINLKVKMCQIIND